MPASAPIWAGIAAGAATGALTNRKDPLMGAIMGGMGGYGGMGIGAGLRGAAAAGNVVTPMTTPGGYVPGTVEGANIGLNIPGASMMNNPVITNPEIAKSMLSSGQNLADPIVQDAIKNVTQNAGQTITGAKNFVSNPSTAWEGFKRGAAGMTDGVANQPLSNLQAAGKIAMPIGGAVLSGLEPSDLGYTNLNDTIKNADKYDPYATLNLAGDTGLRLYASGGPVSFADGGDAMKGGGAGAMEGAGLMAVDVSDINTKYGYDPEAKGTGLAGMAATPKVPVPMVGAFADADIINNARDAYERQLIQSMMANNRFGAMIPNRNQNSVANQLNQARTGQDGQGNPMTIAPLNVASSAPTAATAPTATTAPTANTLNLNRNYADGGSITSGGIRDLYGSSDDQANGAVLSRDGYGLGRLNELSGGGIAGMKKGGYLDGAGDGMSDSIPATIEGNQPARLADGEFVVPADVVSHLGNGSSKAGAKQLYSMMDRIRQARTGNKKQGKRINALKHLPA